MCPCPRRAFNFKDSFRNPSESSPLKVKGSGEQAEVPLLSAPLGCADWLRAPPRWPAGSPPKDPKGLRFPPSGGKMAPLSAEPRAVHFVHSTKALRVAERLRPTGAPEVGLWLRPCSRRSRGSEGSGARLVSRAEPFGCSESEVAFRPEGAKQTRHQKLIKFSIKKNIYPILLGRPLIKFSRFECCKFCEFWNLPIYPDFTNLNINSCRNRLRLQLIPYLKYFFNINLNQKITQIQELINLENQYFKTITQKIVFSKVTPLLRLRKALALGDKRPFGFGSALPLSARCTPKGCRGTFKARALLEAGHKGTGPLRGLRAESRGADLGIDSQQIRELSDTPKILRLRISHAFLNFIKKSKNLLQFMK